MITLHVTITVKPGCEAAFVDAATANHRATMTEPGAHRFDVLRDTERPEIFYLYEVYEDEAALEAHRASAHFAAWRDAIADLLVGDRTRILADVLEPSPYS
jgi:quinol monooxygenase YgiN